VRLVCALCFTSRILLALVAVVVFVGGWVGGGA
jgi:hypothetical protein